MSLSANPLVERYLDHLASALSAAGVGGEEREAILREIASHAAEALLRGERLAQVLERLGSPAQLAEAYAAEAYLRPAAGPAVGWRGRVRQWARPWLTRITRPLALLTALLLSAVGAWLGLVGFAGTLLSLVGPWLPFDPTLRAGWPQLVLLVLSLASAAAAFALLRLARWNLALFRRHHLPGRNAP
jgi:uncharacterized membrane protein